MTQATVGRRSEREPLGAATSVVVPFKHPPPHRPSVDPVAAEEFLRLFHAEQAGSGALAARLPEVRSEIESTGTYWHTPEELAFGAMVAWRNSARCIGRLYWRSLQIRDRRTVREPAAVAGHAVDHLRVATNGGKIRPTITIFAPDSPERPGPRIWNEQLIRYAGYRRPDGTVLGDPRYADFTNLALKLGWTRSMDTAFDVLPLLVDDGYGDPQLFELPADAMLEVPITHPRYRWFAQLGLRWHAVPAISNMCLEIGGICYPAAPFNGWYMGTEIGARNLADRDRYNLLPVLADRFGYDMSSERSLWRDRALVELNLAVLHSYNQAGVTMSDHHTESERFITHLEREERSGRQVPADWTWVVPPISGAATRVFHRYYDEVELSPRYVTREDALARALGFSSAQPRGCPVHGGRLP